MARPKKAPEERRDDRPESAPHHGGTGRDRAARRHPWHQPVRFHAPPFPGLPPARNLGRAAPRRRLAVALLRLGVNLNQIARRMNAGRGAPPDLLRPDCPHQRPAGSNLWSRR